MVERVKRGYVENGLAYALEDKPLEREYIRKADSDLEVRIIALSCSAVPESFARWSLRMLADNVIESEYINKISYETIRQA